MSTPISYNLAGAASASGLSSKTLTRHIATGKLPAFRSGPLVDGKPTGVYVIKATDLEAFIDGLEAA